MFNTQQVHEGIYWVGASDRRLSRFENLIPLTEGVSYNSYLIMDDKTVLMDTVDESVYKVFLDNVVHVLDGRALDYLVIQHMEPDHGAGIIALLEMYPDLQIVANAKVKGLFQQFFPEKSLEGRFFEIKEGSTLETGHHCLKFIMAPMVHWPEVFMTYDETDGLIFTADAFGGFKALAGNLFADTVDFEKEWVDAMRVYYFNIVGKHGAAVMRLFKKVKDLKINKILPLHGLCYRTPEQISRVLELYTAWASYEPETKGVVVVYASMYGNTQLAADYFCSKLGEAGINNIHCYDVSQMDRSFLLSELFRYSHFVIFGINHNMNLYFPMHTLLEELKLTNFQKRHYALVIGKSWAGAAQKIATELLESMPKLEKIGETVELLSAVKEETRVQLDDLAKVFVEAYQA